VPNEPVRRALDAPSRPPAGRPGPTGGQEDVQPACPASASVPTPWSRPGRTPPPRWRTEVVAVGLPSRSAAIGWPGGWTYDFWFRPANPQRLLSWILMAVGRALVAVQRLVDRTVALGQAEALAALVPSVSTIAPLARRQSDAYVATSRGSRIASCRNSHALRPPTRPGAVDVQLMSPSGRRTAETASARRSGLALRRSPAACSKIIRSCQERL